LITAREYRVLRKMHQESRIEYMQRVPDPDVDKFLSEEKAVEERRKQLIEPLLKKREAQNREIDDQLAKLGYHANDSRKRSHHKKAASSAGTKSPKG
jgi:hypothetical protein